MDGNISKLVEEGLLVWMPAHQSSAAVGVKVLSDGRKLSWIDWKANRLVDALAKQAAAQRQAPAAILRILKSAQPAVRHSAALLGRVTHAANHCQIEVVLADGRRVPQICRDAQQHTGQRRGPKRQRFVQAQPLPAQLPEAMPDAQAEVGAWRLNKRQASPASLQATRRAKIARAEQASSDATAEAHVQRLVEEASQRMTVPAGRELASVRMQKLRERVLTRAAASAAGAA